ncbi:MAG: GNAT family N-acetyltransferase [Clostridiales bacterium]|jgi:predicted GNAT family acetyltransferase|nr:GNAT family N-acetyltransferase [Clostridiales bacterium]
MIVQEYNNAQAFLGDHAEALLQYEAISQLILYNACQNLTTNTSKDCIFGTVIEDGKTWLYFCKVTPYNYVIYTPEQGDLSRAVSALAEYTAKNHIKFSGLNARHDICLLFIEEYSKLVPCTFIEKLAMDIMEIREVNDIKLIEGKHRLAKQEEVKLITDWMIQFHIEALDSEMDYEAALKRATELIEDGRIYVYENPEGQIVTMAAAGRKLIHGIAITYVFTPEEFRGKGYAASNIYHISKNLLEEGYEFCTLFVDKRNPISVRAYEKVGYKIIEENYEYIMIPSEE